MGLKNIVVGPARPPEVRCDAIHIRSTGSFMPDEETQPAGDVWFHVLVVSSGSWKIEVDFG